MLRTLSNILIVVGYVAAGLFAGIIAAVFVNIAAGSLVATGWGMAGGALAGLVFGLRRVRTDKGATK
jgi:hypothetical protein